MQCTSLGYSFVSSSPNFRLGIKTQWHCVGSFCGMLSLKKLCTNTKTNNVQSRIAIHITKINIYNKCTESLFSSAFSFVYITLNDTVNGMKPTVS